MDAAMRFITVRSLGSSADPHPEIAIPVKLQNKAIAAPFVRFPRRAPGAATAYEPDRTWSI
jgi:hypothetical protein